MTKEQRLELLKQIEKDIYVSSLESTFLDDAKSCAIHSIINELEQEPILDKIRAEIVKKHLSIVEKNDFDNGRTYGYEEVLGIIDKYKAESETQK